MFKNIDEYLKQLKRELKESDPALIQDALSDAEEHLRNALENALKDTPEISEVEVLQSIIEKYGEPHEIASAYKEIESHTSPVLIPPRPSETRSVFARYFGTLADHRAWGAFFYMVFSVLTGSIYGLWAGLGACFSLFSLIFIIGIPITGLFLLSVRGIALMEGRIVEALLGVRMPRKPLFVSKDLGWLGKLKALFTELHTWKALAYMILQFPLGMIYFFVALAMFTISLTGIAGPLLELVFHLPLELFGPSAFTPVWLLPFISIAGMLLLPLTLHLAIFVGKIHGKYAKAMLVRR